MVKLIQILMKVGSKIITFFIFLKMGKNNYPKQFLKKYKHLRKEKYIEKHFYSNYKLGTSSGKYDKSAEEDPDKFDEEYSDESGKQACDKK